MIQIKWVPLLCQLGTTLTYCCVQREKFIAFHCVLFVQSQNHPFPMCPFRRGGEEMCSSRESPGGLGGASSNTMLGYDTLIFAQCSKGAQLHVTCAPGPCLLLRGRKNRCNFKLAALQLLRERLEVSGGKDRAAQGSQRPVFSWFFKVLLQNCIKK